MGCCRSTEFLVGGAKVNAVGMLSVWTGMVGETSVYSFPAISCNGSSLASGSGMLETHTNSWKACDSGESDWSWVLETSLVEATMVFGLEHVVDAFVATCTCMSC